VQGNLAAGTLTEDCRNGKVLLTESLETIHTPPLEVIDSRPHVVDGQVVGWTHVFRTGPDGAAVRFHLTCTDPPATA
jgi:hypothetical protein